MTNTKTINRHENSMRVALLTVRIALTNPERFRARFLTAYRSGKGVR